MSKKYKVLADSRLLDLAGVHFKIVYAPVELDAISIAHYEKCYDTPEEAQIAGQELMASERKELLRALEIKEFNTRAYDKFPIV